MPAGRIRTQGLTEGAILAALVAIIAVATWYIPFIGLATVFFCPLPLAMLVIRHGFRVAALAAIVSALIGAALAGPLVGFLILISFAPTGLVMGIGSQRGWSAVRIILVGALVGLVPTALSFLGLMGGNRMNLAELASTMERSAQMSAGLYARLGLPQAQIDAATKQMQQVAKLLPFLLPMMVLSGALSASWLNYEVGRRVLARFGYRLNTLTPIRTWRVPVAGIWLVPVGALLFALSARPGAPPALQSIGWSLWLTTQFIFLFQGVVTGWVVLGNYGLGKLAQVMAVVLALTTPIVSLGAFYLGLLDSVLKVRDRWGLPKPRPVVPKADP